MEAAQTMNSKLLYKSDKELLAECRFRNAAASRYGEGDFKIVHDAALDIRDRNGGTMSDALRQVSKVYWNMVKGD